MFAAAPRRARAAPRSPTRSAISRSRGSSGISSGCWPMMSPQNWTVRALGLQRARRSSSRYSRYTRPLPALGAAPRARPAAELERLVAADVHLAAREVRQELGVERRARSAALSAVGRQGRARAAVAVSASSAQRARTRSCFNQRSMCPKPFWLGTSSMPRSRAPARRARAISSGVNGEASLPDHAVVAVREGVFGVELELVHAQELEQVDELAPGRHRRARGRARRRACSRAPRDAGQSRRRRQGSSDPRAGSAICTQRARAPVQTARVGAPRARRRPARSRARSPPRAAPSDAVDAQLDRAWLGASALAMPRPCALRDGARCPRERDRRLRRARTPRARTRARAGEAARWSALSCFPPPILHRAEVASHDPNAFRRSRLVTVGLILHCSGSAPHAPTRPVSRRTCRRSRVRRTTSTSTRWASPGSATATTSSSRSGANPERAGLRQGGESGVAAGPPRGAPRRLHRRPPLPLARRPRRRARSSCSTSRRDPGKPKLVKTHHGLREKSRRRGRPAHVLRAARAAC